MPAVEASSGMIAVVVPLRIPVDVDVDVLTDPLLMWLEMQQQQPPASATDDTTKSNLLTPAECFPDVQRLASMRQRVGQLLQQGSLQAVLPGIQELQEYAAALQSFLDHGFILPEPPGADEQQQQHHLHAPYEPVLSLRWRTAPSLDGSNQRPVSPEDSDIYHTLRWERANVLWNITTLECYQATLQNLSTKQGWMHAGEHFSKASGVVRVMRKELYGEDSVAIRNKKAQSSADSMEEGDDEEDDHPHVFLDDSLSGIALSDATLQSWEGFLIAEAHRSAYEAFRSLQRPRHFMLAKLAAAAVPLFQHVEDILHQWQTRHEDDVMPSSKKKKKSAAALVRAVTAVPARPDEEFNPILSDWEDAVRAWGMWMSALTEYHQALVHKEKSEWGMELARLEGALRFGRLCQQFCDCTDHPLEQGLDHFEDLLRRVEERQQEAVRDNEENYHMPVPDHEELPEIARQKSVKENPDISKLLPALSEPFFAGLLDPTVRYYVQLFRTEMDRKVNETAQMGDAKTESARIGLAKVNLPHSLTAYRQEQNGGGIPDDLWNRVAIVQQDKLDVRLKQDLWELRDLAETARSTHKAIEAQLEEDLQMDSLFREQHGSQFEGHDVHEIQKTFRSTMENYDRLIRSAEESDAVLMQRCETLDTDSKFRLLKFHKQQLDRCLPGGHSSATEVDVSSLSQHLVELSAMFSERDTLVHTLRERVKTYDITAQLGAVSAGSGDSAEVLYRRVVDAALRSFDGMIQEMTKSLQVQDGLVDTILQENQQFMRARDSTRSGTASANSTSNSESIIVKLDDALEELDQLSDNLREGKAFYEIITPKLNKLKQQVGDVSARLTNERCEFEDRLSRSRQEAHDARMAASFNGSNDGSNDAHARAPRRASNSVPAHPGVEAVSNREPSIRVDDEKVASLVAMDFDPDKVVAALKKYDNDVEQALNELLGC